MNCSGIAAPAAVPLTETLPANRRTDIVGPIDGVEQFNPETVLPLSLRTGGVLASTFNRRTHQGGCLRGVERRVSQQPKRVARQRG